MSRTTASRPRRRLPLTKRTPLLALVGLGSMALGVASSTPVAREAGELAGVLADASGAVVVPGDVRWEPSRGAVEDLFLGRFVLFLGSQSAGGPRDVYRARVRLTPEGAPLGVARVSNLTSTPLGDDHALVVRGTHAAYATFAFGQEQSVTVLDLAGEGTQNATKTLHDRAMAWVTNVQQTGSGDGVGRIDVTLDQPAVRVGLAIEEDARTLVVQLADDERARTASRVAKLDLEKGELVVAPSGLHAEAGRHLPKRLVFWAVDTVRAVPWIGPAPIAWLEERTFAVRDTLRQTVFRATGGGEALAATEPAGPAAKDAPAAVLDGSQAGADVASFPPPAIKSIWKTPEAGEGVWAKPVQPWIKHLTAYEGLEAPPSPFYTTFVRPDEERPYAKVLLVAMDMRQLDLDMEAGSEDPKPLVGPPGKGRIPRDAPTYSRIAAAFNGGFKTEHGNYGMMVQKRVLLPPVPGAATVIVTKDHHVGMGSWGTDKDVGGIQGVDTADILSFRQNLDPLVENDKVNPSGRGLWGFTLPGTSMQTERSGICITSAGHLYYAWGDDVSATTLGKGMKMAGCIYGMHLDMNPHHTGLIFTNITELKGRNYKSELLSKDMEIMPDRYIEYAPKDFFFVKLHDPTPPAVEGATWSPDPGAQPAPAWMPGVWKTRSADVDLTVLEPGRATFRVRAGTKEPDLKAGGTRSHEVAQDDAQRVLFALTLGVSTEKRPRGLVTDGRIALPVAEADSAAAVVASEDGQLEIVSAKEAFGAPGGARSGLTAGKFDAVELPWLFDDETKHAASHLPSGSRSVAALGTTKEGRLYLARTEAGADAASTALRKAGCTRAVVLDRGAGGHGVTFRTGTQNPPRARYDESTVYAMSKPLLPRGFKFESLHPVEPPAPKKK